MCKLFSEWEKEIRRYCVSNGLDFSKAEKSGKCWRKDVLMLQHIDPDKGKNGMRDETPAPVILVIKKQKNGLVFEQTEYTHKYLAH